MERDELVKSIAYECSAIDGFLVSLRAVEFREKNFNTLLDSLVGYREAIRNEGKIDRTVAYCLYHLDLGLLGSLKHATGEFEEQVSEAHKQLYPLIEEILFPEDWSDFPERE